MMKVLMLGVLLSWADLSYGSGGQSEPARIAPAAETYACFQEGSEQVLVSVRQESKVVFTRPDGTTVHEVTVFLTGKEFAGYGIANSERIQVDAVDPIEGDIQLRTKKVQDVHKGRVLMLGDMKNVKCYVRHDKPVDPEQM